MNGGSGGPCQVRLCVATRDGQSTRIAGRVAERLGARGIAASIETLPATGLTERPIAGASLVVLVAAVRYGRHLPEAVRFLARFRRLDAPPALAIASVSLTARKPGRQSAATNPYLRRLLRRERLAPALAVAIAGRLDYRRYRWFDRQMIRLIMAISGGPTRLDTATEFTCWSQVEEFAAAIAAYVAGAVPARGGGG